MLSRVSAGVASVDLAAAKAHLRVSHSDDDTVISAILGAALSLIGESAGRSLSRDTWLLSAAGVSGDLRLPMPPIGAVTGISIYAPDGTDTALTVSDFYLFASDDFAALRPKSGAWPATQVREDAIRVTFTAGYQTAPQDLAQAVLLMVKRDYDGLTGTDAASYDRAIEALVASRRLGWVAA